MSVAVFGLGATQKAMKAYDRIINAGLASTNMKAAWTLNKFWKIYLSGPGTRGRLGRRSGFLARSVNTKRVGPAGVTGTPASYAAIHEGGGKTRPHVIRPRVAKVLAFKVGTETVFAKSVRHPGSKMPARPHMMPALRAAKPAIDKIYDNLLDEAAREAKAVAGSLRRQSLQLEKRARIRG